MSYISMYMYKKNIKYNIIAMPSRKQYSHELNQCNTIFSIKFHVVPIRGWKDVRNIKKYGKISLQTSSGELDLHKLTELCF